MQLFVALAALASLTRARRIAGDNPVAGLKNSSGADTAWRGRLLQQNKQQRAPAGSVPMPKFSASYRDPVECNCDFCVSVPRLHPTQVSDLRCDPAVSVPTGQICHESLDVVTSEFGIVYDLWCRCHCKPILSDTNVQCLQMSIYELAEAAVDDGSCEDPQLPSAEDMKRYKKAKHAIIAARQAAEPPDLRPTAAMKRQQQEVQNAKKDVMKNQMATTVALDSAKLLSRVMQNLR
eukprot:gnl/TRDRNA2_/TRDRNA2_46592_c0_seq1.p1 gnl/TRDRNA2_/TRDRNA2_46592_c0~~gnl/TRDRNA2_/TRDRNA2_46592_c0_seq1.p1  ORF type:complete len:235 (-),score=50.93 gnl/TRDRNA2_/TRDRNA2_46592_c0_seq1:79-783(-)